MTDAVNMTLLNPMNLSAASSATSCRACDSLGRSCFPCWIPKNPISSLNIQVCWSRGVVEQASGLISASFSYHLWWEPVTGLGEWQTFKNAINCHYLPTSKSSPLVLFSFYSCCRVDFVFPIQGCLCECFKPAWHLQNDNWHSLTSVL